MSEEGNIDVVWKEKAEKIRSKFSGMSQESILGKISVGLDVSGNPLPNWFDEEQGELLSQFAEENLKLPDDFAPLVTICLVN